MSNDFLEHRTDIWRGRHAPALSRQALATGFETLDELLPGGGWPVGALTEILADEEGTGALWLTMPALARLSQTPRWLAWVAPPHIPYAPALAGMGVDLSKVLLIRPRRSLDRMWALEQALRSGTCSAVLAWPTEADIETKVLRRLQLAAEAGQCWGVLFRSQRAARRSSPAALRLHVRAFLDGISVHVLKCRGGWTRNSVELRLDDTRDPGADGPLKDH